MSQYSKIINAMNHIQEAHDELIIASCNLKKTGYFKDTIKEIDDTIFDLSKSIEIIEKHTK